jgi:predicted flap endonuclease-1-like 5' DNA nuclease
MLIEQIAQGGDFDTVEAIRYIALQISLNRKLLAELSQRQAQGPRGLPAESTDTPDPSLEALASAGIPLKAAALLAKAGHTTPEQVATLTNDELSAIDGIGPGTIALIRRKLKQTIPF